MIKILLFSSIIGKKSINKSYCSSKDKLIYSCIEVVFNINLMNKIDINKINKISLSTGIP